MTDIEREAAWHYLCSLHNIGIATSRRIAEYAGDVVEAMSLNIEALEKSKLLNASMLREWRETEDIRLHFIDYYNKLEDKSYSFISHENPDFPRRLLQIDQMPLGLWYKGKLPDENKKSAAIIGSRVCTEYGLLVAGEVGRQLARWGIDVISGMALGVDSAGQRAALKENGYSAAVLGCGVDICYPRHNIDLYHDLEYRGGIISEFAPGTLGYPVNFRQRNRIISGLSDCVIVTEAKMKSGTQVTVSWALDQGKDIFAVPGRINDSYSKGCNELIYQGAAILNDLKCLKEYFGIADEGLVLKSKDKLSKQEEEVYKYIKDEMVHFEHLLFKTGLNTGQLMSALMGLERKEYIIQPVKNYYKKLLK